MAENNGSSKNEFEDFLDEMGEEKRELAEHKEKKKRLAKKGPSMPPAPKPEDPPAPSGGKDDEPEQPDGDAGAAEEEPEEIAPPAEEPEPSVRTEPNPPAQTFDSDGLKHHRPPGERGVGDIKRGQDRVRKFKERQESEAQQEEQWGHPSDQRRRDPETGIMRLSEDELRASRHRRPEGSETPYGHLSKQGKKNFHEEAKRDLKRRQEQFNDDPDTDGPDLDR